MARSSNQTGMNSRKALSVSAPHVAQVFGLHSPFKQATETWFLRQRHPLGQEKSKDCPQRKFPSSCPPTLSLISRFRDGVIIVDGAGRWGICTRVRTKDPIISLSDIEFRSFGAHAILI